MRNRGALKVIAKATYLVMVREEIKKKIGHETGEDEIAKNIKNNFYNEYAYAIHHIWSVINNEII